MPQIACPSCGTNNPAGSRFCGSCGSALDRACPNCATLNPAGNRFCGSCGADLDPTDGTRSPTPVGIEERKVASMLFADLTASTEMASRLDPEDLRGVLHPFYEAMAEEIGRYGGTVEKFIGDAVVAAFGAPVAHEDDPERAIRCAIAMHRRLAELNADLSVRAGGDLTMRIGINTGDVLAHGIEEGIVTGEAVNVAARLQAVAEPGRVVVGERTYRDARDAFAFDDLGEVDVKGIDRALRVYRVRGELTPADDGGMRTPFVGREREMDLLRLLFGRTVEERRPNLVTIVGPPGIGKTRLSHEAARVLAAEGARVVRGRCLPYGDGLTYWPLAEILKADAGILDSDPAEVVLVKIGERIDPRFPGQEAIGTTAVLLSSIGIEQHPDPLAGTELEAAQRLIAGAWQRYLESLVSEAPLVALIEDIHWADPGLLQLIEAVVSRALGPALIVCTTRPDVFDRRSGWGGGMSNATTISLSPLTVSEGTELIERLLDGNAPVGIVGPVLHRSEGNPFFAGELLRMMIEDGTIARRNGRWALERELPSMLPDTVQSVIASRIDMLPTDEKMAIQDAAVIGRTFWAAGVERLGVSRAYEAIDALVGKDLVTEKETSSIEGQREFVFSHVLTRDVAYASIPKARRAGAHAVVGEWMEEGTRGRADEFAEILAHHFSLAGDGRRSARYALLAGNRHLRMFAAQQAIEWFERALDAAPDDDLDGRSRMWLARGEALEQIGRFGEALAAYEEALACARDAGEAELQARSLAANAHVLWLMDRYDEGTALLPEALDRARAVGLADVESRLLYTAGTLRFGRGEFASAIPLHDQALEVARAAGDVEGQALAHHGLCESYFFKGPFEKGLAHGEEADRLFRDLGQRSMVAHNAYMVAWLLGFLGRADEGSAAVDASIATSKEIGNRREEAFALFDRAELRLARGLVAEALADAEAGTAIFRELGLMRGEIVGLNVVNDVLIECWAVDRVRDASEQALTQCSTLGGTFQQALVLGHAGWSALAGGDRAAAERFFELARGRDEALLDVAWSARIEILARERDDDAAGLASAGARVDERIGDNDFWGGWGSYARGLAAWLEGDPGRAVPLAKDALRAAEAGGQPRLAWRAGRVMSSALRDLGRPDEADRLRARAAELVRAQAGATPGDLRSEFLGRRDVAELLG